MARRRAARVVRPVRRTSRKVVRASRKIKVSKI